jgi:hypothetical protein
MVGDEGKQNRHARACLFNDSALKKTALPGTKTDTTHSACVTSASLVPDIAVWFSGKQQSFTILYAPCASSEGRKEFVTNSRGIR